jgi:hypothetical protein
MYNKTIILALFLVIPAIFQASQTPRGTTNNQVHTVEDMSRLLRRQREEAQGAARAAQASQIQNVRPVPAPFGVARRLRFNPAVQAPFGIVPVLNSNQG